MVAYNHEYDDILIKYLYYLIPYHPDRYSHIAKYFQQKYHNKHNFYIGMRKYIYQKERNKFIGSWQSFTDLYRWMQRYGYRSKRTLQKHLDKMVEQGILDKWDTGHNQYNEVLYSISFATWFYFDEFNVAEEVISRREPRK
jgi:hypothetical protein